MSKLAESVLSYEVTYFTCRVLPVANIRAGSLRIRKYCVYNCCRSCEADPSK